MKRLGLAAARSLSRRGHWACAPRPLLLRPPRPFPLSRRCLSLSAGLRTEASSGDDGSTCLEGEDVREGEGI